MNSEFELDGEEKENDPDALNDPIYQIDLQVSLDTCIARLLAFFALLKTVGLGQLLSPLPRCLICPSAVCTLCDQFLIIA